MTWTYITSVESDSTPGTQYQIKRRSDGALGCDCAAFRFSRGSIGLGKRCKHVEAYLVGEAVARNVTDGRPERVEKQSYCGETFTFRRAISFDGNLSQR